MTHTNSKIDIWKHFNLSQSVIFIGNQPEPMLNKIRIVYHFFSLKHLFEDRDKKNKFKMTPKIVLDKSFRVTSHHNWFSHMAQSELKASGRKGRKHTFKNIKNVKFFVSMNNSHKIWSFSKIHWYLCSVYCCCSQT